MNPLETQPSRLGTILTGRINLILARKKNTEREEETDNDVAAESDAAPPVSELPGDACL